MPMRLCSVVLLVVMCAGAAEAQERPANADWAAVAAALGPGAAVKVRTRDGQRITGTMIGYSAEGIRLQPRTRIPVPARDLAYTDIETLERARKPLMSPGAKIALGVGIGAAVVLLTSALVFAAAAY